MSSSLGVSPGWLHSERSPNSFAHSFFIAFRLDLTCLLVSVYQQAYESISARFSLNFSVAIRVKSTTTIRSQSERYQRQHFCSAITM